MFHHHELFIYVVAGNFEITVPGEEPVKVAKGDALLVRDGADRVVNTGRSTGAGWSSASPPPVLARRLGGNRRRDP